MTLNMRSGLRSPKNPDKLQPLEKRLRRSPKSAVAWSNLIPFIRKQRPAQADRLDQRSQNGLSNEGIGLGIEGV